MASLAVSDKQAIASCNEAMQKKTLWCSTKYNITLVPKPRMGPENEASTICPQQSTYRPYIPH